MAPRSKRWLLSLLAAVLLPPHASSACGYRESDSLAIQMIVMDTSATENLAAALREQHGRTDTLGERAEFSILYELSQLEAACRSNLMGKLEEPGSPWLAWRSLGRTSDDSGLMYVGAVSCTDSLCGQPVRHDRLAIVRVGTRRATICLLPPEPVTIGDQGTATVDSTAIFHGRGYTLVQARRRASDQHPCYDGGNSYEGEEAIFAVVRGDSVVQAFVVEPSGTSYSHDDVDGDGGTEWHGTIRVTAERIELTCHVDDWDESLAGGESKVTHKLADQKVRFVYSPRAGRFVKTR